MGIRLSSLAVDSAEFRRSQLTRPSCGIRTTTSFFVGSVSVFELSFLLLRNDPRSFLNTMVVNVKVLSTNLRGQRAM